MRVVDDSIYDVNLVWDRIAKNGQKASKLRSFSVDTENEFLWDTGNPADIKRGLPAILIKREWTLSSKFS